MMGAKAGRAIQEAQPKIRVALYIVSHRGDCQGIICNEECPLYRKQCHADDHKVRAEILLLYVRQYLSEREIKERIVEVLL